MEIGVAASPASTRRPGKRRTAALERKPGVAPLDLHKAAAKSGWSARTIKGWYVGR